MAAPLLMVLNMSNIYFVNVYDNHEIPFVLIKLDGFNYHYISLVMFPQLFARGARFTSSMTLFFVPPHGFVMFGHWIVVILLSCRGLFTLLLLILLQGFVGWTP